MDKLKIAVFAAGQCAQDYITQKHENAIVAIFDNDKNKWGKVFCGYVILAPQRISEVGFDYLVIATIYEKEVKAELIRKYPDLADKICSVSKMNCLEYIYGQYKRRYAENNQHRYPLDNKKIVVYTGIFGKYDTLQEPLYIDKDVDYICYTDDRNLKSENWEVRYIECEQDSMALEVRKYKCLPHRFLPEYDISIWIDARLQIKSSITKYIEDNMRDTGLLFFPHDLRDCVYEEGAANIIKHRENVAKIVAQMNKYIQEGYPEHNGLYCGGYIVREHNCKKIIKIMEEWYEEILRTTVRDQISLPYVMWKNNSLPDICRDYIYDNKLFKVYCHNI